MGLYEAAHDVNNTALVNAQSSNNSVVIGSVGYFLSRLQAFGENRTGGCLFIYPTQR